MFNLEKAIAAWRRSFKYRRVFFEDDLEELERHVRDHAAGLVEQGWTEKEAFGEAVRGVGDYRAMESEYRKVYWGKLKHRRRLLREIVWEATMLKNYFKITLRNLQKHKGYAFINVGGLALGITCCLLILFYVQDELSYDRFHEQAPQIHRVLFEPDDAKPSALNMFFVGPRVVEEYPDVRQATRLFRHWESPLIAQGQQGFVEEQFFFADGAFFDVFSFSLREGDPQTALDAPFSVVLTESAARKYFGDEDPMGKTLRYNTKHEFRVTGVLYDVPLRSHFHPDFVASMPSLPLVSYGRIQEEWKVFYTYVVLQQAVSPAQVEQKTADFYRRHFGSDSRSRLRLQPLTAIHLHSQVANELEANGDVRYLYLLSAIGLMILLIACINYMNLATARSTKRAREVGMRKMVGAHRLQIIRQFFGESLLLSILALLLSIGLVRLLLPVLSQLTGKALTLSVSNPWFLPGCVGVVLFVGLLAGSYPAMILSRFRPAEVLKGRFESSRHGRLLRRTLVVVQFAASVVLIVGTLVVSDQLDYVRTSKLGFDKEQVVVIPVQDPVVRRQYAALGEAWLQAPDVLAVGTSSSSYPGRSHSFGHTVRRAGASDDEAVVMYRNWVDHGFIKTLGIELAAGRDFTNTLETDEAAVLLNEAAVKALGWASAGAALGQVVTLNADEERPVIGVVKDFHFKSLHHQIEPLIITPQFHTPTNFLVRIRPADMPQTLAALKAAWEGFSSDQPFTYSFLDETVDVLYRADAQWGQVIGYAALLAILIGCLGLFGLAAFSAEQRTKEIGVRKVLGASISGIVVLLSRDFLKLVLVAFVVAAPVAYVAMNRWLENFVYRIEISWRIFLMAGLIVLLIVILTVSYQAIKAALADPVKALRYE